MFAIQCSKPQATNAITGIIVVNTLSMTVRPAKPIHTARHTSTLHRIPRKKITPQSRPIFAAATLTMVCPTAPEFIAAMFAPVISATIKRDPAMLPK